MPMPPWSPWAEGTWTSSPPACRALAVPLTGVEPREPRTVLRARLRSQLDALGPEEA
ncbi:hypothetical protein AB0910_02765 [Streptomyces sp. NPDC047002]|uniref:hypothetical protein n=1 Tax=Streptomyces sp. NPDC047002 TaxID=3155475 RepID=UPI00345378BA